MDLSRRELLRGGGLLGALWVLQGCQSGPTGEGLTPALPGSARPVPPAPPPAPTWSTYAAPVNPPPAPVEAPADAYDLIPRTKWTSAGVGRPKNANPMNGITRITVHHDGMGAFTSTALADASRRLTAIRTSHMARRSRAGEPWADIGYHYIIDPGGRVWEGRPVRYQGAHVEDQNEHNLGIMCLGNFELQSPSSATLATLDAFVLAQMRLYRVPLARVFTHREIGPTECPGRNLQRHMVAVRARGGRLALA